MAAAATGFARNTYTTVIIHACGFVKIIMPSNRYYNIIISTRPPSERRRRLAVIRMYIIYYYTYYIGFALKKKKKKIWNSMFLNLCAFIDVLHENHEHIAHAYYTIKRVYRVIARFSVTALISLS